MLLIRRARLVPITAPAPRDPVDLRVDRGHVTEVAPTLGPLPGEEVIDVDGRWVLPGLWDHHVHLLQWAQLLIRLDTSGTGSAAEVLDRVRAHLDAEPPTAGPGVPLIAFGHRIAAWPDEPTVAELDDVVSDRPVILISGDAHHGWINSAALRMLGFAPRAGIVSEAEWFEGYARLGALPEVRDQGERAVPEAITRAAAQGVVGITDFEFGAPWRDWIGRGAKGLRVRAATYADGLDQVITAGWHTGQPLDKTGLVRMGPLKIISDGSLNTRTAFCCEPYLGAGSGEHPFGVLNTPPEELRALLRQARGAGLEVAVHAIGDAAVGSALDAFTATGARGRIEHAQLMAAADIPRMAALGIVASVQPAHLLDDRDVADVCWADRTERCFALRSMVEAGVTLVLGSDAPVSPLDPWLEIAAAVRRTGDGRPAWHPEQALTAAEALAASTDGQGTLTVGSVADLVVTDDDPLSCDGAPGVVATLVGGRFTHRAV